MRSITALGLCNSMQVRYYHFGVRSVTDRFRVISNSHFVYHVSMTGERVAKWIPAVLEVVIDHLAF
jgi:hypothetical protein